jgi:hypothetical protein
MSRTWLLLLEMRHAALRATALAGQPSTNHARLPY